MTRTAAKKAIKTRALVEAGEGDDRDIGRIISIDGDMAYVAWQSGVRTPCPIAALEIAD